MMQNLKKWWNQQVKEKRPLDIKTMVMAVMFLIFTLILLWIALETETEDVGFNSENAQEIKGAWQVSYKGKTIETELPASIDASAGDTIMVSRVLDIESIQGNSMIFYARQSWVTVYLDGEVLVESARGRKVPFEMTPGSYWYLFRLPEDFAGKTLTIELEPAMDRYAKEVPTIYVGTKAAIIYTVLMWGKMALLLGIPVLFLGIGLLGISFFVNQQTLRRRFCRLGLFAIVTSTWSLLESRVTQLLFGDMVIASYLLFSCYYLIPVLAVAFLLTYETLKKRKYMKVLFWVSAINFFAVQLLQVTGLVYYIQMVSTMHVLIALILLGVIYSYFNLCKKKEEIPEKSIYRGIMILSVFCALDIINYYARPEAAVGSFSKVGILVFFAYLAYAGIRQVSRAEIQAAENRVYLKLAYTDMMTGLSNRTAFEKDLEDYRKNPWREETIIMVGDMNRLKFINDNYGHAHGDKALTQIAELMKKSFSGNCKCYRTGGDEFCVIGRGISEKQFAAMCKRFLRNVLEAPQEEEWRLSVSCGYCVVDDKGIDECYKKADAIMYADKIAFRQRELS